MALGDKNHLPPPGHVLKLINMAYVREGDLVRTASAVPFRERLACAVFEHIRQGWMILKSWRTAIAI